MDIAHTEAGALIINDAYNANVISTGAALQSLATLDAVQRFAVLGVMDELGDRHDEDHQAIAALCEDLGIRLIAYREAAYGVEPMHTYAEIFERLGELGQFDAVLVKASRIAELEKLAAELLSR